MTTLKTRLRELPRADAQLNTHKNALGVSAVGWPALGCSCCPRPEGRGRSHLRYDAGKLRVSGPDCSAATFLDCHRRGAVVPRRSLFQKPADPNFWHTAIRRPTRERAPFHTRRDRLRYSLALVTETPNVRHRLRSERDEVAERIWNRRREERPRRQSIDNPTRRVIAKITNAGLVAKRSMPSCAADF
jgi:hypothetical protein